MTFRDENGRPVEGVSIHWEVTSGGGSMPGIPFIVSTDQSGRSAAEWTLGMVELTQTARATAATSAAQAPSVTFTATASGTATELLLVAGDNQVAITEDTLPVPLRVRAISQTGQGVGGVPVVWAAVGGGQVFPSPAVTDAQGEVVATWTLGPNVGAQTATASVTGLSGSPRTFTATASPAANTLTWTSEQLPGTWSGIWASSPSDVFAVGSSGTIRHFNGSSWDVQNSATTNDLRVIWGDAPNNVFAAGTGGTILRYDGVTWSPMAGTPSDDFFGIWASSLSDVFAAGRTGMWHYTGTAWSKEMVAPEPICQPLGTVWGSSARDVWVVGTLLRHYDGTTWSTDTAYCSLSSWRGVWGSGPSDVYVVGKDINFDRCTRGGGCPHDGFILHYDGTSWHSRLGFPGYSFNAVWVTSSAEAVAVGANGLILHYDGTRWRRESSGTTQSIVAVSGSGPQDVWAITGSGLILHGTR